MTVWGDLCILKEEGPPSGKLDDPDFGTLRLFRLDNGINIFPFAHRINQKKVIKMGLPYYNKYVGDYARDTRGLSLVEHGAYNLLLDDYYSNGCLKHSLEQCFRVCMAFEQFEREAVQSVLAKFFTPHPDGGYFHKRVEEEILKQNKIYQSRVYGGKKTAAKRWANKSANSPANSLATDFDDDFLD